MSKRVPASLLRPFLGKKSSSSLIFLGGFITGYQLCDFMNPDWQSSQASQAASRINVCFTPGTNCTDLIVREIRKARVSLKVQAYSFSSPFIAQALTEAAQKGVDVQILLDKSQFTSSYSALNLLQKQGIKIKEDRVTGIAHNKIILIDDKAVITGSFNFTNAAQDRNAENVVLIQDLEVVRYYLENWKKRWEGKTLLKDRIKKPNFIN